MNPVTVGEAASLSAAGEPAEPNGSPQFRKSRHRTPATDGERRALASVVRLRILRMCLYESLTNKVIADRLQRDPATVLHHVRTLVAHGFLQAGDQRTGPRGAREVPYRATGKSWSLDYGDPSGGAEGQEVPNTVLRTFFEEVAEVPESSVRTTRIGLQLTEEHYLELAERIEEVLEDFASRPHDGEGRRWSLFLAVHPEPGDAE